MDPMEKNRPPPYNDGSYNMQPANNDPYPQQSFYPNVSTNQPTPNYVPMSQPAVTNTSTTVVLGATGGHGGCPVCHNMSWTGTYSCCAWLLCLFCFPCGVICCCCMRKKKCTKCGYTVG